MGKKVVSVEFLFAGGCGKCAEAREALRDAAQGPGVEWKEIDIAKNPHRAVDLGVVSTPAVAIDGKLMFGSMPSASELRDAIRSSAGWG
ncbi:MAG: thioredoxin family protein [Burkholderiales bacterium]